MTVADASVIDEGRAVRIDWHGGRSARFHAVWLRDNALDAQTRSPANGQRLITLHDIPADVALDWASVTGGGNVSLRFLPDGKTVTFPSDWLALHVYDAPAPSRSGWTSAEPWDRDSLHALPSAAWTDVCAKPAAMREWLAAVRRHGVALLHGVPIENGAVERVVRSFGYVRETNYGRHFDVRVRLDPRNLADTNLGLQAHTDNPYRDPAPTLQLLHCLANDVEGGASIVVDGFRAAAMLRAEWPECFALLAGHCARFDFAGEESIHLAAKRPILECAPDGELVAVRFNSRSAAPFVDVPYDRMESYYAAYRRFAALVDDPRLAVTFRLAPGDLFMLDNTRVLHGRTAFAGGGERWLQGCYADKDALLSTLRVLEADE